MIRALLKDSVTYAIPTFLARGLSLFLVPLYTRVLSPAEYGSLDLLVTLAGLVNVTIALEVSQGLARHFATEPRRELRRTYAASALWFTLVAYSVFAVVMLFTPRMSELVMGQTGLDRAFQIGIAYIWVYSLFYLVQNQFRWELQSGRYAVISITATVTTAVLSVILTLGARLGLVGLLLGMLSGCLVGMSLGLWWLRSTFVSRPNLSRLREMLAFSTPLVISSAAIWLNAYADRMMIRTFLSIDDVGLYGVGYRAASVAGLALVGFSAALTPLVYTHHSSPETPAKLAQIFRWFTLLALSMFVALALFAPELIRVLAGPNFSRAAGVVFYLVPVTLLANMYIFAPGIWIAKKTSLLVWISLGGALLNLGLNPLLLPLMGIEGAGLATLTSYIATFLATMMLSQRLYPVPHSLWPLVASTALAGLTAWMIPALPVSGIFKGAVAIAALLAFVAISYALGLVQRAELQLAVLVVRSRLARARGSR